MSAERNSEQYIPNSNEQNKQAPQEGLKPKNYYEILGVDKNIPQDELNLIYRRKAKKVHPDLNPNNSQATKDFQMLGEAYGVLNDKTKRAEYDQKLSDEAKQHTAQQESVKQESSQTAQSKESSSQNNESRKSTVSQKTEARKPPHVRRTRESFVDEVYEKWFNASDINAETIKSFTNLAEGNVVFAQFARDMSARYSYHSQQEQFQLLIELLSYYSSHQQEFSQSSRKQTAQNKSVKQHEQAEDFRQYHENNDPTRTDLTVRENSNADFKVPHARAYTNFARAGKKFEENLYPKPEPKTPEQLPEGAQVAGALPAEGESSYQAPTEPKLVEVKTVNGTVMITEDRRDRLKPENIVTEQTAQPELVADVPRERVLKDLVERDEQNMHGGPEGSKSPEELSLLKDRETSAIFALLSQLSITELTDYMEQVPNAETRKVLARALLIARKLYSPEDMIESPTNRAKFQKKLTDEKEFLQYLAMETGSAPITASEIINLQNYLKQTYEKGVPLRSRESALRILEAAAKKMAYEQQLNSIDVLPGAIIRSIRDSELFLNNINANYFNIGTEASRTAHLAEVESVLMDLFLQGSDAKGIQNEFQHMIDALQATGNLKSDSPAGVILREVAGLMQYVGTSGSTPERAAEMRNKVNANYAKRNESVGSVANALDVKDMLVIGAEMIVLLRSGQLGTKDVQNINQVLSGLLHSRYEQHLNQKINISSENTCYFYDAGMTRAVETYRVIQKNIGKEMLDNKSQVIDFFLTSTEYYSIKPADRCLPEHRKTLKNLMNIRDNIFLNRAEIADSMGISESKLLTLLRPQMVGVVAAQLSEMLADPLYTEIVNPTNTTRSVKERTEALNWFSSALDRRIWESIVEPNKSTIPEATGAGLEIDPRVEKEHKAKIAADYLKNIGFNFDFQNIMDFQNGKAKLSDENIKNFKNISSKIHNEEYLHILQLWSAMATNSMTSDVTQQSKSELSHFEKVIQGNLANAKSFKIIDGIAVDITPEHSRVLQTFDVLLSTIQLLGFNAQDMLQPGFDEKLRNRGIDFFRPPYSGETWDNTFKKLISVTDHLQATENLIANSRQRLVIFGHLGTENKVFENLLRDSNMSTEMIKALLKTNSLMARKIKSETGKQTVHYLTNLHPYIYGTLALYSMFESNDRAADLRMQRIKDQRTLDHSIGKAVGIALEKMSSGTRYSEVREVTSADLFKQLNPLIDRILMRDFPNVDDKTYRKERLKLIDWIQRQLDTNIGAQLQIPNATNLTQFPQRNTPKAVSQKRAA